MCSAPNQTHSPLLASAEIKGSGNLNVGDDVTDINL